MRAGGFAIALALSLSTGCADDGEPWGAVPLPEAPLRLYSADVGVYPDRSVLRDPANPFRRGVLLQETVWQLQSNASTVTAFYAWATANARGPSGERQYYAALDLKAVYQLQQAEDAEAVRAQAIRGFQAVLDHFPDAVTYDATGTIAYELATPSAVAIIELGGQPEGWVVITDADGTPVAVPR